MKCFHKPSLIQLSKIIESHLRVDDIPTRYGGEEFLIMLPLLSKKNALNIAERIRKEVEEQVIYIEGVQVCYTIGCGVSSSDDSKELNKSIQLADKALYTAKRKGCNCNIEFL